MAYQKHIEVNCQQSFSNELVQYMQWFRVSHDVQMALMAGLMPIIEVIHKGTNKLLKHGGEDQLRENLEGAAGGHKERSEIASAMNGKFADVFIRASKLVDNLWEQNKELLKLDDTYKAHITGSLQEWEIALRNRVNDIAGQVNNSFAYPKLPVATPKSGAAVVAAVQTGQSPNGGIGWFTNP